MNNYYIAKVFHILLRSFDLLVNQSYSIGHYFINLLHGYHEKVTIIYYHSNQTSFLGFNFVYVN